MKEDRIAFSYQIGGSLASKSPSYVERKADRELQEALQKGEFCYVLNSRQMGKSSLRVRVMENLQAVLAKANMTFENVVKTSIFISDMNNFMEINEVYASFFNSETAPARETVQVAGLPKKVNVEISMIAVLF